jgi:N6-adenosine-specific RNA methylase IME4
MGSNEPEPLELRALTGEISLNLPPDLPFEQWLAYGEKLRAFHHRLGWLIGDWLCYGEQAYGEKYRHAAAMLGWDYGSLANVAWVVKKFQISCRHEDLSFTHHQEVAALESADAERLLQKAEDERWSVKQLRAEVQELRRTKVVEKLKSIESARMKETIGLFDVIVIDPPWPMEKIERDVAPNQVKFDYPTMGIAAIAETVRGKIHDHGAPDCHVWLWTTHKFLPAAMTILEACSLKYVCTFVWHKPGGFQPFSLPQYNCEFALYARKGSPQFADLRDFKLCFEAPRGKHSEKPEEFYTLLRRVTRGRRLDMFNRRRIEGFEGWGKEAVGEGLEGREGMIGTNHVVGIDGRGALLTTNPLFQRWKQNV